VGRLLSTSLTSTVRPRAGAAGEWERERERHRFAMVRDFSLDASFKWAPMEEGRYEIKVKVKDGFDAVAATSTVVSYEVSARATGGRRGRLADAEPAVGSVQCAP